MQSINVNEMLNSTRPPEADFAFFWLLVRRDLKTRYAGSSLGAFWNLIHPLMLIAIYMTIFSSLMPSRGPAGGQIDYGPLNYGVHLVGGLLPWLLFSDVLLRSTMTLIENSNFLQKVAFPPLILFLSVFFNAFLINGAGYVIFLVLLIALGHTIPLAALGGLGVMALFGVTAMGLGLALSGIHVFFRDTAQILNVLMQLLFWFNPIVYDKVLLYGPGQGPQIAALKTLGQQVMFLNPFERFITASQTLLGATTMPATTGDWWVVALCPVICLILGLILFRRMLPDVRDCL